MKLHIGNIATTVTDAQLKELVVPFGETTSFEIIRGNDGTSKGFGFADFADDEQAKAAIKGLNGQEIGGQALKVAEARPRKGGTTLRANR